MIFSEAINAVELVLEGGDVPLIIGDAGIGKTALVKRLCNDKNLHLVTIDANLLKEGEIGGLPIVEKGKTSYATHYKLLEVEKYIDKKEKKGVLIFIDELNRCEHAVQQELMNLILNREINGYYLDSRVKIIAAMNPSNKYEGYEDSNYQVVDMDQAQEDRFVWIEISSDIKEWMKWAMGDGDISEDIIEFLSTFPEYLNTSIGRERVKATPRSWERISKAYRIYKNNPSKFTKDTFYNVVKGNVGSSIANDFINYVRNIKNPLIKAKELFAYKIIPFELREKIQKESHSRLYILAKNSLVYLEENRDDESLTLFSTLLSNYPRDLRLGIMKEIKSDYSNNLYELLLEKDEFIDAFFDIYAMN